MKTQTVGEGPGALVVKTWLAPDGRMLSVSVKHEVPALFGFNRGDEDEESSIRMGVLIAEMMIAWRDSTAPARAEADALREQVERLTRERDEAMESSRHWMERYDTESAERTLTGRRASDLADERDSLVKERDAALAALRRLVAAMRDVNYRHLNFRPFAATKAQCEQIDAEHSELAAALAEAERVAKTEKEDAE